MSVDTEVWVSLSLQSASDLTKSIKYLVPKGRGDIYVCWNLLGEAIRRSCYNWRELKPRQLSHWSVMKLLNQSKCTSPYFGEPGPHYLPWHQPVSPEIQTLFIAVLRNGVWYQFCACHSLTRKQHLSPFIKPFPSCKYPIRFHNSGIVYLNQSLQLSGCFGKRTNHWDFLFCYFMSTLLSFFFLMCTFYFI